MGEPLALLLDIDGTLVLTDHLYVEVFRELLKPHNYDADEAFFREHVAGRADADVFRRAFASEQLVWWHRETTHPFAQFCLAGPMGAISRRPRPHLLRHAPASHMKGRADHDASNGRSSHRRLMPESYGAAELHEVSRTKDRLFCELTRKRGLQLVPGLADLLEVSMPP